MTTHEGEQTTIPTPDGDMPGWLWTPEGGSGPGVLLLQEIFGVSRYIKRRGAALAEAGYVVLAPELYWRLDPTLPPLDESAPDVVDTAMSRAMSLDWEQTVSDAVDALSAMRARDGVDRVGLLGFCFGGGLAFNVAAVTGTAGAGPDALVSYYGSALPNLLALAPQVSAPSLHHFGLDDAYIPVDTVRQIESAVTASNDDVTFLTYPGAGHAFDNPSPVFHHDGASQEAWAATTAWLAEKLPV